MFTRPARPRTRRPVMAGAALVASAAMLASIGPAASATGQAGAAQAGAVQAGAAQAGAAAPAATRLHVVLLGDSHARMMDPAFAALSKDRGFRYTPLVLPNCSWMKGLRNKRAKKGSQRECRQFQKRVYERALPRLKPDVVFVTQKSRSDGRWKDIMVAEDAGQHPNETFPQMLERKVRQSIGLIGARSGARVSMIANVFGTAGYDLGGFDPAACVRKNPDCLVRRPAKKSRLDRIYGRVDKAFKAAYRVDFTPVYCTGPKWCRAQRDGRLVWEDASHLSEGYLIANRGGLWSRIQRSGVLPRA